MAPNRRKRKSPNGVASGRLVHSRLDAIYPVELLAELPDCTVDLIVSSPPYNLGQEYESRVALDHYVEEQSKVLAQCARVLKVTGSIFWQVGAYANAGYLVPLDTRFFPVLENLGMIPRNRIIWVRQHGLHATRKFSCRHETNLWFTKAENHKFHLDPSIGEPIGRYRFDVQVGARATKGDKAQIFPEEHHQEEFSRRIEYEESAFAAKLRGEPSPTDHDLNGRITYGPKRRKEEKRSKEDKQIGLFSD